MTRVEVFWYRSGHELAANTLAADDSDPTTLPDTVIVDLPEGLAERLNAATDLHAEIVDEILTHLRDTGQTLPPEPQES